MEQKKSLNIFAAIVIFLYAAAVIFFGFSLLSEYKTVSKHVDTRFTNIAKAAIDECNTMLPGSSDFNAALTNSIGHTSDVAGIQIVRGDLVIFSWPADYKSIKTVTPFIHPFTTVIATSNNDDIVLNVALYVLKPQSIYKYAKIAFIVVLAATLCTVVFLIYMDIAKKDEEKYGAEYNSESNFAPAFNEDSNNEDTNFSKNDSDEIVKDTSEQAEYANIETEETKENNDAVDIQEEYSNDNIQDIQSEIIQDDIEADKTENTADIQDDRDILSENSEEKADDEKIEVEDNNTARGNFKPVSIITEKTILPNIGIEEEEEDTDIDSNEEAAENIDEEINVKVNQVGKYSPLTKLCWPKYLIPSLNDILEKSKASNTEVSLMYLKINMLDRIEYVTEDICNMLIDIFKDKDLLFEDDASDDAYILILQEADIEKALEFAGYISKKVTESLTNYEKDNRVIIGISSKASRDIDAEVLVKEARHAMEKAYDDDSNQVSIIAFRVNPEKYKEYIERNKEIEIPETIQQ